MTDSITVDINLTSSQLDQSTTCIPDAIEVFHAPSFGDEDFELTSSLSTARLTSSSSSISDRNSPSSLTRSVAMTTEDSSQSASPVSQPITNDDESSLRTNNSSSIFSPFYNNNNNNEYSQIPTAYHCQSPNFFMSAHHQLMSPFSASCLPDSIRYNGNSNNQNSYYTDNVNNSMRYFDASGSPYCAVNQPMRDRMPAYDQSRDFMFMSSAYKAGNDCMNSLLSSRLALYSAQYAPSSSSSSSSAASQQQHAIYDTTVMSPVMMSSSPANCNVISSSGTPGCHSNASTGVNSIAAVTATGKKISTSKSAAKKRRRKDSNEPQKPVSAYALFFRDTQAAIKCQNPSASFGETSKIVAAMWDSLGDSHKNVYRKRTETAKKLYLKQLATYRATLLTATCGDNVDALTSSGASPSPTSSGHGPAQPTTDNNVIVTSHAAGDCIRVTTPQQIMTSQYHDVIYGSVCNNQLTHRSSPAVDLQHYSSMTSSPMMTSRSLPGPGAWLPGCSDVISPLSHDVTARWNPAQFTKLV